MLLKRSALRGEQKNATQSVTNVVEGEDRTDVSRAADESLLLYSSSSHNEPEEREQISVSIATFGVRLRCPVTTRTEWQA